MKIGVCSVNSGPYATPDMLDRLARSAEDAGVESIWASEHLVVPDPKAPPSNMDPRDPILDPVTSLAYLAARTSSVLLGTGVIVLPLRNPLILAKELATVDVLSGGRLVLGIGVGYVEREFEALGASFGDRGVRLEEYLASIRAIWTEPRPSFDGATVSFAGVQAFPHPVRRPPIVMGGYAPPVMRRTIREADGWFGWGLDLDATARRIDVLRETAGRVPRGVGLGALEISITPPGDVDVETAARYAALGVDRLNLQLPWGAGPDDLERFFERVVRPLVRADLRVGGR
jgi:probable F420-dependent oxidoreductase